MFDRHHLLRQLILLVLLILVSGTVGYTVLEDGWSLFDGFYMTLITLTTIGFGEVHALTTAGRWLTVFIVVFGLGSAATILSQLAQLMMEGNLTDTWRKRRMEKKIARMKDHVIICGYGRIGGAIAADLSDMGVSCVIIDRDEARKTGAQTNRFPCIGGNATSDGTLLSAGVERAAILVAALSNDSDNLFVALAARDLNPHLVVIARGEDKSIETRMLRAGVDRVVYPAQLGGGQIARLVGAELGHDPDHDRFRRITDVMGYDLQVHRNFQKEGVTVGEILLRTGALQVVAHLDADGKRHRHPGADHLVKQGEAVVLLKEVAGTQQGEQEGLEGPAIEELKLDIPAIDEEHSQVLTIITRLRLADSAREQLVIGSVLGDLRDYLAKHFHHEEQLFLSAEFPAAEAHMRLHKELLARMETLIAEGPGANGADLAYQLERWFQDHILLEDRKYAAHMAAVHA